MPFRDAFGLRHNLLRNRIFLFGTLAAQLVHIGAMYTPWLSDVLKIQLVSLEHWMQLPTLAHSVLVVLELHEQWFRWSGRANPPSLSAGK